MAADEQRRESSRIAAEHTGGELATAEWRGRVTVTLENLSVSLKTMTEALKTMVDHQSTSGDTIHIHELRIATLESCANNVRHWIQGVMASLVVLLVVTLATSWWRGAQLAEVLARLHNIK